MQHAALFPAAKLDFSCVPTLVSAINLSTTQIFLLKPSIFIQQITVLIPRDTCASMSVLCLQVSPGTGAGWTGTSDDENIECIDITAMLDCDGKFWACFILVRTLFKCTHVRVRTNLTNTFVMIHFFRSGTCGRDSQLEPGCGSARCHCYHKYLLGSWHRHRILTGLRRWY